MTEYGEALEITLRLQRRFNIMNEMWIVKDDNRGQIFGYNDRKSAIKLAQMMKDYYIEHGWCAEAKYVMVRPIRCNCTPQQDFELWSWGEPCC